MAKRGIVIPLIVLVVAALLFFVIDGKWTAWSGSRAEQETDDAYVRANMTPLSTRISGTVRKMKVEDFDSVKAGQVLVEIDDDDYRSVLQQAQAALAASQATLNDNQAAKRIQEAKIQNAEAMVAVAEAAVSTARAGWPPCSRRLSGRRLSANARRPCWLRKQRRGSSWNRQWRMQVTPLECRPAVRVTWSGRKPHWRAAKRSSRPRSASSRHSTAETQSTGQIF